MGFTSISHASSWRVALNVVATLPVASTRMLRNVQLTAAVVKPGTVQYKHKFVQDMGLLW